MPGFEYFSSLVLMYGSIRKNAVSGMLAVVALSVALWPGRFANALANEGSGAASFQAAAKAAGSKDAIPISQIDGVQGNSALMQQPSSDIDAHAVTLETEEATAPQQALSAKVVALLEQKNYDAAIAAIEADLAQAEIRSAPRRYKADLYMTLGHAYLAIARFEEARRHLLFANFLFHGLLDEEPLLEAVLLGDLGKAYAGEEPYTTSADYFRQAITLLSWTPDKEHLFLMSHLACNLARLYESWQLAEAVATLKQRCLNAFRLSAMRQVPRQQHAIMNALDALPPAWVPRNDGHDYVADPVVTQASVHPSVGPAYPEEALRQGHEGFVVLRAALDEHGTLLGLVVASSSGYESLDQAALQAARQWRYESASTRDGKAVASSLDLPFGFIAEETF